MKYSNILFLTLSLPCLSFATEGKHNLWSSCTPCHDASGKLLPEYAKKSFNHDDVEKKKKHTIRDTLIDFGNNSFNPEDNIDIKGSDDVEAFEKILIVNKQRKVENIALKKRYEELSRKLDITVDKSIEEIFQLREKNKQLNTNLTVAERDALLFKADLVAQAKKFKDEQKTFEKQEADFKLIQKQNSQLKDDISNRNKTYEADSLSLKNDIISLSNENQRLLKELASLRQKEKTLPTNTAQKNESKIPNTKIVKDIEVTTKPAKKSSTKEASTKNHEKNDKALNGDTNTKPRQNATKNQDELKIDLKQEISVPTQTNEIIFDLLKHQVSFYTSSKQLQIMVIEDISGNKINGILVEYFPSSNKIKRKGRLINGERDGLHELFNEDGTVIFTQIFENGSAKR